MSNLVKPGSFVAVTWSQQQLPSLSPLPPTRTQGDVNSELTCGTMDVPKHFAPGASSSFSLAPTH